MRTLRGVAVAALLGSCSGGGVGSPCTEDPGYTSGSSTLSGTILALDGSPQSGATLTLTRAQAFDLFHPTNDFQKVATADGSGAFSFTLKDDELRNGVGGNLRFYLGAASVPGTTLDFFVNRTRVHLPPLQPWDATASATVTGDGVTASWADLATLRKLSVTWAVSALTADESAVPPAWKSLTSEHSVTFSAAQLEDFKPTGVTATPFASSCADGSVFAQSFAAASGAVSGAPSSTPVSRGAPCTADVAQSSGTTCPVTSGTLDYLAFGEAFATLPQFLTLDLSAVKSVRRVVARGLMPFGSNPDGQGVRPAHKLEVTVSDDGQRFTHALGPIPLSLAQSGCFGSALTTCYLDLPIEPPVSARFVRVGLVQDLPRDANGNNLAVIAGLTQLSVWE